MSLLPNPKGKDDQEAIRISLWNSGTMQNPVSGIWLSIKGKKKKLPEITIGEDILLTGKWGLPNTATCIDLGYQESILDTLCYPKPKEAVWYGRQGEVSSQLSDKERLVLEEVSLVKQGNSLCLMYKGVDRDCRVLPSTKTNTKIKQENKLYTAFITLLDGYLQDTWPQMYYADETQVYFNLFHTAKQRLQKNITHITTDQQDVAVYDLATQINLLQTYSLAYRAKIAANLGQEYLQDKQR